MHLIRLLPSQQRVKKLKHPAFKDVVSFSFKELEVITQERLNGRPSKPLILALRSTARYLVGRYLWHYPATCRFLDEMVSEALLAITMMVNSLERDMLIDSNIQKIASKRIRYRIEDMLNNLQGFASPSMTRQKQIIREGQLPIYLYGEREPQHADKETRDAEEAKFDLLDAVFALREECATAHMILDSANWGLPDAELAEKMSCSHSYVCRCRCKLLSQYLELIGELK